MKKSGPTRDGYFAQQSLDLLDPELTVMEPIQKYFPLERHRDIEKSSRSLPIHRRRRRQTHIRSLSGGEKSRLAMARMIPRRLTRGASTPARHGVSHNEITHGRADESRYRLPTTTLQAQSFGVDASRLSVIMPTRFTRAGSPAASPVSIAVVAFNRSFCVTKNTGIARSATNANGLRNLSH